MMRANSSSDVALSAQSRQSFKIAAIVVGAATGAGYGIVGSLFSGLDASLTVASVALVVAMLGGLGGLGLTVRENAPVRLGASRRRYLLLVPGMVLVVVAIGGWLGSRPTAGVWALLTSSGAVLGGWVIASMARTRYVAAVRSSSTPVLSWTAALPQTAKRRRYVLGVVTILLGIVALLVGYAFEQTVPAGVFGGAGGAIIGSAHRPITLHAHEEGLEVERALNRDFIHWEQFEGYEVTDTELRLHRSWRSDLRCARSAINDFDGVVEAVQQQVSEQ